MERSEGQSDSWQSRNLCRGCSLLFFYYCVDKTDELLLDVLNLRGSHIATPFHALSWPTRSVRRCPADQPGMIPNTTCGTTQIVIK